MWQMFISFGKSTFGEFFSRSIFPVVNTPLLERVVTQAGLLEIQLLLESGIHLKKHVVQSPSCEPGESEALRC